MKGGDGPAVRLRFVAATLVTAKLVAVALRAADGVPVGRIWLGAPLVWLGQDVAVVAVLYALDRAVDTAIRRRGSAGTTARRASIAGAAGRTASIATTAAWLVALAVALAGALSVPAVRLFGTPLTWTMWQAAGGALADSLRAVATPSSVGGVAVALLAGIVAAMPGRGSGGARRAGTGDRPLVPFVVVAVALVAASAAGSAGTGGLGRNAVVEPIVGALRAARWTIVRWRAEAVAGEGATAEQAGRSSFTVVEDVGGVRATSPVVDDIGGARATSPVMDDVGAPSTSSTRTLHGAAAGRHIVWIVLESVHADYLGLYGGRPDPAPSVAALGAEGWVFDAAYTVYPESIKSLWALLCAAAPAPETSAAAHGAGRRSCTSLPDVLGAHGYTSSLWHSGRFDYFGMREILADRGFSALHDAADLGAGERSSFAAGDAALVDAVLRHVDATALTPAAPAQFLLLLPASGHHPYESPGPGPRPFGETPDFRRYLSDVFMGDDAIRRLIDGFKTRGLYDRTLWVLSGDHGEAFFQHPGNFAHSLRLYEENVHVPLSFTAPGSALGPRRVGRVVSTIDIAPTILDLVGIPPTSLGGDGTSALGDGRPVARFFTDHTTLLLGLREGDWKVIAAPREGEVELYDLADDPRERHNVAGAHADVARAYGAELARWLEALRTAARVAPAP